MELNSEIEINASPETVWKLLTDTSRFPEWNPFIRRLVVNSKWARSWSFSCNHLVEKEWSLNLQL